MASKRLAIVSSHPIQYHAAWFRRLASEPNLDVEVFFCHQASPKEQAAAGFGVEFDWDVSLLEGYSYRFLPNVARTPSIRHFRGLDTPEVANIIARAPFDAVMVNGWHYKSAWQTIRACWKTRTPVMVRSDSHLHTGRSLVKRIAKRPFYSWFISKLDACLPVGQWSSDYFLHYGAKPDRVLIVPHVVDTDFFKSELQRLTPQHEALRGQWKLAKDATVFVFAGKFTDVKRPLDFVSAIARSRGRKSGVMGLMVGDGPLRAACEEMVKLKNLPISFTGFLNQSRIAEAYVAADALILPSTAETWGLVVNEAMACGRPCFVSDEVGCGPDMIKANKTGVSFQMGNVSELSDAITLFAENGRRGSMGVEALKEAERYSLNVGVDRTMQALEAVTR